MGKVEGGRKRHGVKLYALSTCMWCRKTRKLLEDHSVEYEFVEVDQLQGAQREEALRNVKDHNPDVTFPTIVVDGRPIIGYREAELKGALEL